MSLRNRLIGVGEGVVAGLLFYGVYDCYGGEAPWYVGVPYFLVHGGLVIDSISRVILGESAYGLKEDIGWGKELEENI